MNPSSHVPAESPANPAPSTPSWEGHLSNGVGATTGSDLASLTADASQLVLSGTLGTYHVPRTAVVRLGRGSMYPWFFAGIRIHHRHAPCPAELQFNTDNR